MWQFIIRHKGKLIVLLVVMIAGGYWYLNKARAVVSKTGNPLTRSFTVKRRTIQNSLSISGTIEAEEKTTLQFQTSGRLAWVGVKEGDRVRKWQAVASLDTREVKKNLEKKLNDFLDTRWDYDQMKDDNKSAATGDSNIYLSDRLTRIAQQSQFGLNKTILDVEIANLTLELSSLVSPIDGVVTRLDQPIAGVNTTPATSRVEIVNPDTLYLRGLVDQQDVVKLSVGKKAQIIFDPYPDTTYSGEIYYISYVPETGEDNSYALKIHIPAGVQQKLRIGMGGEATIIAEKKTNVIAVPPESIFEEGNQKFVYIRQGNTPEKQPVTTGLETDDYTQITSGLKTGTIIVY